MIISILILLSFSALYVVLRSRRAESYAALQRHYIESILLDSSEGERYIDSLSLLSGRRAKCAAAEVIASLSSVVYRLDSGRLVQISNSLHLPQFLLFRAAHSRGSERALCVALLSQIPSSELSLKELEPFAHDKDRMVQLFALLASIHLDSANAMHYIASYRQGLTPFELSQLLSLLRQGSITVAYQPMLESENHNLNMLGLAIVREFGIETAHRTIRDMVARGGCDSIRREALYTLAVLRQTLSTPSICGYVGRMGYLERQHFLRFVACEGYSQRVVDSFISPCEHRYFHSLIDSYKVKI